VITFVSWTQENLGVRKPKKADKGGYYPRVSYPDPDWIRIQSGQWILIRIRNSDPDPGGQK
jgi:hypothetical protein